MLGTNLPRPIMGLMRNSKENKGEKTFDTIQVADCQYDTLSNAGHDLFFSNDTGIRYYNALTKQTRDFTDVNTEEYPCIYCKDETHQYILYGETGEEIYKKEYSQYSKSCFTCCGMTEQGPVFYDARYSSYLYPENGSYKMYSGIFNNPFMIWGRYKRGLFKTTLSVSFQFHHTQMDGAHAAKFLDTLQREIEGLKA